MMRHHDLIASNIARRLLAAIAALLLTALLLGACATGPKLRVQREPDVDFSQYETFGFVAEPGTDRAGYSTLTTQYFKQAVRREMEALGYRYSEDDPDLLANFFARIETRTEVHSHPTYAAGYYGYRYGLYTAWPYYLQDVETVHYRVGTANIDIVDAERRQLIWEGVAEGRLTRKALDDPGTAIDSMVRDLFGRFPPAGD